MVGNDSGPFGILRRQFSEAFNKGWEGPIMVGGVFESMAQQERKDTGEGSNVVVFEVGLQVVDLFREGKIEDGILFSVIARRDSDGVSDGMFAHPRFKGRGVFGIRADVDGEEDEVGCIIDREFNSANVEKADPILSNNVCLEGIVSDLGRMAEDAKANMVRVEDGSHLEESNSMHGGRKVNFEKVGSINDLFLGEGCRGASKEASSSVALGHVELGKDKGTNLKNGEGHFEGKRLIFGRSSYLRSGRKSEFLRR